MIPSDRLGVVAFGRALIESLDLDPVYVALWRLSLPPAQLKRWLLAYWCFYHAGAASRLSEEEGLGFYRLMREADRERWPRGRERRHFRGRTCATAIGYLEQLYRVPERAVDWLTQPSDHTPFGAARELPYALVRSRAESWPGFGPWIAFKIGDMLERLGLAPVVFEDADLHFYAEPARGALLASAELKIPVGIMYKEGDPAPPWCLAEVSRVLAEELSGLAAPPRAERSPNLQEVETVLCKWKSHRAGRYPVGLDICEIRHALSSGRAWGDTASRFLAALPATERPWS